MHIVKLYRKRHKLTRVAFGLLVGVGYETVRRWEKRKLRPGPKVAIKIEDVTAGEIGRHELRPDLWPPEDTKAA